MALCGREREKTRWGLGERPPLAERMMQNETISPRMRDAEAAAAKCSTQCNNCWSPNSSDASLILQMQQHMENLLEIVLNNTSTRVPSLLTCFPSVTYYYLLLQLLCNNYMSTAHYQISHNSVMVVHRLRNI
jgi:hypothetical protein